jgi:hypothetical protein
MTIDRLRASLLANNMNVRLSREERRTRASERNAEETERRCKVFRALKQGAKEMP